MLFTAYINIREVVPIGVTVKLFADDAKLYFVFGDRLTPDWLQFCWRLFLICPTIGNWNYHLYTKCFVLQVVPARASCTDNNFSYHIDNVALPVVNFVTDLGVT